ncbi:hypothetical protein [Arthrobacter sp. H5]|uniref:hypothetical protein n=1 Tax=Arthrobacter sp. H5 TaxID=1267973 RepID=UPI0004B8ED68|nr:hypothetical protein [Arthrobacter sp. H5]
MRSDTEKFTGHIAGLGTTSGVRIVIGMWESSPLGAFTDVMVQSREGTRTLLAPSQAVADYVSSTYTFDLVRVVPLTVSMDTERIALDAGPLSLRAEFGERTALGKVLGALPRAIATHPKWLTLVNPIARILFRGVRTAGSTGDGKREYYGVTDARSITSVAATWAGDPLGKLAAVKPRVQFGFSSAPKSPQVVDVTTTIIHADEPDSAVSARVPRDLL